MTKEEKAAWKKKYNEEHKVENAARARKYYQANKEKLQAYARQYSHDHREERLEKQRQYKFDHKDEIAAKRKQYRQDHKAEMSERDKKEYQDHKEYNLERRKKYYRKNRVRQLECARQYRQTPAGKAAAKKGRFKRRALKAGVDHESFNPIEVLERDGYRCQLCSKKTRKDYNQYHPLYPVLDHIVPLTKGGKHTKLNTQCLCQKCNHEKYNTGVGDQLRMFG